MKIAGFVKNSFVDYRGKVASVVFTPYCNLNCYFCHNSHLLTGYDEENMISHEYVFDFLKSRKGLIEALVISGGEPLINEDIAQFLKTVKNMGYYTKLDTNGTFPEKLTELLEMNILDFVAMDIKAPFKKYTEITGININTEKIKKSISILMESNIEKEFRTTFVPVLSLYDIEEMAGYIKGADYYVLQQFKKPEEKDRLSDMRNFIKPHPKDFLDKAREICMKYVRTVGIRGA